MAPVPNTQHTHIFTSIRPSSKQSLLLKKWQRRVIYLQRTEILAFLSRHILIIIGLVNHFIKNLKRTDLLAQSYRHFLVVERDAHIAQYACHIDCASRHNGNDIILELLHFESCQVWFECHLCEVLLLRSRNLSVDLRDLSKSLNDHCIPQVHLFSSCCPSTSV